MTSNCLFFYSVKKYLMSTCYMSGIKLSGEGLAVNGVGDMFPVAVELIVQ